ncbi:amidohydrolase [Novosphingobium flavum]|uniref:Amidohydrolase n=1 Tax=Novosphingobium flavum TaxID=1778672 RepID=A0A7X1KLA7_9SPHN|nr:amidohydrolase family protein [Novosphingobium flavum]MBC2665384.1 amidohydrolase [Novosphingobium flavum]
MVSKLIDIHPHIVSDDMVRYPVTPIGGKRSDWSKERAATMEELVAAMDEAGVDKAAIVHSSTTYGFNNDYVADSIVEYPGRFTGVFSVNVTQPDAPERMRYWYGRGMTGMRIYARGSTMAKDWLSIADPSTMPAWECAAELGISVATNVNARDESLGHIKTILQRFPTVPLVIDHLGRPGIADGPPYAAAADYFDLADYPNLYLKYTRSGLDSMIKGAATPESFMVKLVSVFGANRIAWGSNYLSAPGTLSEIIQLAHAACADLTTVDRRWIFAGTAQRLYPALADEASATAAART